MRGALESKKVAQATFFHGRLPGRMNARLICYEKQSRLRLLQLPSMLIWGLKWWCELGG